MAARSLAVLALSVCLLATPAYALVERTWVSGNGSDSNPCTFSTPCRTIGYAITQTLAGGVVSIKDNATYNTFTVNKSVTVDGGGFNASILHYGADAIKITFLADDGVGNTVVLRGLTLHGNGFGYGVLNNSNVTTQLHMENCTLIRPGTGVGFLPNAGSSTLKMNHVDIREPGSYGVFAVTFPTASPSKITLNEVRVTGGSYGLRVTDATNGTVSDSTFHENTHGVSIESATAHLTLIRTVMSHNTTTGLRHSVSGITTVIDRCSIFGNGTGISNTGSTVIGMSNNSVANNLTDVVGNAVTSLVQQ